MATVLATNMRVAACRRRDEAEQRRLLSFRTVVARSPFMQRASADGEAGSASCAADPDMQAMAQVWAHPEDLHLYPVRTDITHIPEQPMCPPACCMCGYP